jgi:hypothetical protein
MKTKQSNLARSQVKGSDDLPTALRGLIKALLTPDGLGCVVRVQLVLEILMRAYLAERLGIDRMKELPDLTKLMFNQLVNYCVLADLPLSLLPPLRAIGGIRNDVAHRIANELTDISESGASTFASAVNLAAKKCEGARTIEEIDEIHNFGYVRKFGHLRSIPAKERFEIASLTFILLFPQYCKSEGVNITLPIGSTMSISN